MALYDLGTTADEAKKDESFPVAPAGDYRFRVASFEEKKTSTGKDMLVFKLEVIDDPQNMGVNVFHQIVVDPTSRMYRGNVSTIHRAVGKSWEGTQFDPNLLVGGEGAFKLKKVPIQEKTGVDQSGKTIYSPIPNPDPDDPGDWRNEIQKFII